MTEPEKTSGFLDTSFIKALLELWEKLADPKIVRIVLFFVAASAALFFSMLLLWFLYFEVRITITSPKDGAAVDSSKVEVIGTARNLNRGQGLSHLIDSILLRNASSSAPDGEAIWLVVYSQERNKYYPSKQATSVRSGQEAWHESITVGTDRTCGDKLKFNILAFHATVDIQRIFRDREFAGSETLPAGVIPADRVINVTHRCAD